MSSTFFAFSLSSDTTAFQYRHMAREYRRDRIGEVRGELL
jgi:hypothetical protein